MAILAVMRRRALSQPARIRSVRGAFLTSLYLALVASACGDDGGLKPAADYAQRCVTPRTGTGFTDVQGSLLDEQHWVQAWIDDTYLWYSEVPAVDVKKYTTTVEVFDQEKTFAKTASGKDKDQFHFSIGTADWEAMSQAGVEAGYGIQWALLATRPPRSLVIAYTQPNSPATQVDPPLARGAKILTIDGVDVTNGSDVTTLNNGISPAKLNEKHTFVVQDLGSTTPRSVTLTSTSITIAPVQNVTTFSQGDAKIGYFAFTDHIQSAEKALFDAITQLKSEGISDLVLDMRYNGGGYLAIAAELAYMIAGPTRTAGKTFERLSFNDKYPTMDPVTKETLTPLPFVDVGVGFTVTENTPLPHLDLPRVFVLTTADTCSASESVINSLAGIDIDVIQIGQTTCGKPYGFYPTDNCGTSFFAIQFQGVNNKGFGDYADGFTPGALLKNGCIASDDFNHALGDPAEGLLAAALAYRANGTCSAAATARSATTRATGSVLHKPLWLQNRIVAH